MTPEELRAIKERDALVDPYEFIAPLERIHPDGHESVHCVRDRRALLAEVEALEKLLRTILDEYMDHEHDLACDVWNDRPCDCGIGKARAFLADREKTT